MINGLVAEGYSLADVRGMTLRQLLLFTKVSAEEKQRRLKRESRQRLF